MSDTAAAPVTRKGVEYVPASALDEVLIEQLCELIDHGDACAVADPEACPACVWLASVKSVLLRIFKS